MHEVLHSSVLDQREFRYMEASACELSGPQSEGEGGSTCPWSVGTQPQRRGVAFCGVEECGAIRVSGLHLGFHDLIRFA